MPYQNPYLPQSNQFGQYQPPGYMTAGGTYGMAQQQMQPQIHGFVFVTGLEGAKAYQMPPNSEMPLFDSTNNGDTMYIKTTDGAGFPPIKECLVSEKQAPQSQSQPDYVTHDELQSVYSNLSGQLEQLKGDLYGTVPQTADSAK